MKVVFLCSEGFDYSSSQLTEGLHLMSLDKANGLEFITTYKTDHHGALVKYLNTVSLEEACDHCADADMVLFNSGGDGKFAEGIRGKMLKDDSTKGKRAFLDGHDSNALLWDPQEFVVYYKRELRYPECSDTYHANIRSMLFGIYQILVDEMPPVDDWDNRDIDVSFVAFGGSNDQRKIANSVLQQIDGQVARGFDKKMKTYSDVADDCQPLSIPEYRDILRRSKVGVSIPGAGLDTLRFWETMAMGAVLCSPDVSRSMVVRHAPEPHRHAIYFDQWKDMAEQCARVVCNRERWLKMRRATEKLIHCHTTTARAEQTLSIFTEMV